MSRRKGFTLVELLVVIGIIALLISILLPSLNKARKAAYTLKCQSNMKQIALAMIQYINDNKGHFPFTAIAPGSATRPYRDGWVWQTELVRLKYLSTPNAFDSTGAMTYNGTNSSVFFCPEALSPEEKTPQTTSAATIGLYPTDPANNAGFVVTDIGGTYEPFTRHDGQPGMRTVTWYQLNSRNLTTSATYPGAPGTSANRAAPFVFVNSNTASLVTGSITTDPITSPYWSRNQSMVKRSAALIMLLEGSDLNPVDQNSTHAALPKPDAYGNTFYVLRRMGARHGKKTPDGYNAFTNLAYFDGHVETKPTLPFETTDGLSLTESGQGGLLFLSTQ